MTPTYMKYHSGALKAEGIVLIALGVAAILLPTLFTFGIELLIGILLLIGGIATLVRGIRLKGFPGAIPALILGLLTAGVGLLLLAFPGTGVISLTIVLAALFLVQGAAEIGASLQHRAWSNWGWMLASGVASVLIAMFLLFDLPGSAAWAIGFLVGINLLFSGSWLLMLATNVEKTGTEPEAGHVQA